MSTQIPKRIIQTGKTANHPLRTKAMVANLQLLHPDYEYLFFDNPAVEQFVDREFPQYRRVFDSFQFPIQKYDFFRYLAVYRHGGFYFDLDVLLATDLSELLEHGCLFPFERLTISDYLRTRFDMDWEIGNYAFGAAPGHPFLEAVIANCVRAQTDSDWLKPMMRKLPFLSKRDFLVLCSTGPGLVSRTLAENPDLAKTVKVLFPEDVCDPSTWSRFGEFGVHLMDGSWRTSRRIRKRLAGYLELLYLRTLEKESRHRGPRRSVSALTWHPARS
jgi:inositol phosphorylceramide mannosyltransferase catalytic subunit